MSCEKIDIILDTDNEGRVQKFRVKNKIIDKKCLKWDVNQFRKIKETEDADQVCCPMCHVNLKINVYIPLVSSKHIKKSLVLDNLYGKEEIEIKIEVDPGLNDTWNDNHESKEEGIEVTAWPGVGSDKPDSDEDSVMVEATKSEKVQKKKRVTHNELSHAIDEKVKPSVRKRKRKGMMEEKTVDKPNSEFSCEICTKSFKNKLSLSTHKRYCSSDRINTTCTDCNKVYDTYYSYNIHMQTIHGLNPRHQCQECGRAFISPSKLEEHIMHKHNNVRHRCEECDASFTNRYVLIGHMRDKHQIDLTIRRTCKLCTPPRRFKGDQELKEHLIEEHGVERRSQGTTEVMTKDLRCPLCNATFKNTLALSTHRRYCNPEMPRIGKPTCKHCGKCYSTWYTVKDHIKTEHLGILLQCELCGKQLRSKSDLEEHILRHQNPKPFCCHHCDKRFVNKERIKVHIMAKHLDQANYICEVCSKRFVQESDMNKHKSLVHSEERPFPCIHCPKTFKTETYLKNHIYAMHTLYELKQKFECPTCDFVTTKSKYLDSHKKLHLDDSQKVPCSYCGRRFVDEKQKQRHEMIHTGERPYKCDCGQSFKTRVEKREHFIKNHTQDKPFVCEICHEGFADRWQYRNHLNRHESENGITLNKSVRKFMFKYKDI